MLSCILQKLGCMEWIVRICLLSWSGPSILFTSVLGAQCEKGYCGFSDCPYVDRVGIGSSAVYAAVQKFGLVPG